MREDIKERIEIIKRGEVPEGYKKTKVGIVLNEWKFKKLIHISKRVTKKNVENKYNITLTNSATKGVIKQEDYFDKQISNNDNLSSYYVVEKNDYVYNPCISSNAPCGPINKSHFDEVGVMSPLYLVFSLKEDFEEDKYIEFYLKSKYWNGYMSSVANYGARHDRMNITSEDFFNMPIICPSKYERNEIANILEVYDKKIGLQELLINEKQKQKKWLMQSLLTGKKRIKGFNGDWKKVKLGNLFSERVETNFIEDELLSITGDGIIPRSEIEGKDNSSDDKSKYKKIWIGDIGYNTMRMWQGVSAYSNYEGIVSPAYTILKPKNSIDAMFFSYIFKMPASIFLFYRYSQGLVDDTRNLKYSNFKNIKMHIPLDIMEQHAIAQILSQSDKEIELLQHQLEQTKLERKSMMQLLLTGIVRVNQKGGE